MLTVLFAIAGFVPDFFTFDSPDATDFVRLGLLSAYLIFAGGSLVFSILTISPLVEAAGTPQKDIIYYNHILQFANEEEFSDAVKERLKDPDSLQKSLTDQIYAVSLVDKRKYGNIRRCILFLLISLLILIALIIVVFI
jgi:hypothetical protein